jgi:ankyrin repeat protein
MVAAAFAGRIEDLKTAVASGTSPNRIDPKYRISPLSAAVSRGQIEAAKYLLEAGADINFQDSSGYTALMHAILNKQITSVRFLLEKGADLSIKNIARQTALDFARMNKAEDAVSEILKQCPTCS